MGLWIHQFITDIPGNAWDMSYLNKTGSFKENKVYATVMRYAAKRNSIKRTAGMYRQNFFIFGRWKKRNK